MTVQRADVVIVGGGLMGAATAFFLAKRGRKVILLERDIVGAHASGTNFGNVRRQGRFLPQLPLANRSREIWGRLPELIGEDVEFLPRGHLRIALRPEDVEKLESYQRDARAYGLELELISGNALRDRFPYISAQALMGSFSPTDGHANPRLAAPAFARAARKLGVSILEGAEVVAIDKAVDDFFVETKDGTRYRAPILQISAGAWGGRLSTQFGEPVPIRVHGPQMAVTEPVPYTIEPSIGIATGVLAETMYLRQVKRGNIVYGGGGRGPASLDTCRAQVDPAVTLSQFHYVQRLVPALKSLAIIRTWSGVEGYMPDDIPIMGPSARVSGLYYAFGFCGHGFQLGPGVGDVMAELIDTGATATPIAPFAIARFAQAAPEQSQ